MNNSRLYQIALSKIPNVGAMHGRQLVAYCGGVEAIFSESKRLLLRIPGIGEALAAEIYKADAEQLASKDLEYYQEHKIDLTWYLDDDYPERLAQYDDTPILFYSKGNWTRRPRRTVSIVGTRQPSPYGQEMCAALVHDLQRYDVQIISGLAYGVDAMAHKTACKLGIENIAVMGTGIDTIYPAAHRQLSQDIMKNGAIITEYPIAGRADKENFPRRNRVIAAMSDVVVIVQSAKKGGSLITADYANGYHKDTFAYPGRVSDEMSAGCNALIKQHKAHLIESAKDIAYIMRWEQADTDTSPNSPQPELFVELTDDEQNLMDLLHQKEEAEIDWLSAQSRRSQSQLANDLLQLEFKGLVKSLPGKRYMKR